MTIYNIFRKFKEDLMIIKNLDDEYLVGKMVGGTNEYRLYICQKKDEEKQCLLQIAADASCNGALDRSAFILKLLKIKAREIEEEYAQVKKDPKNMLNYDLGFPNLTEIFICKKQGNRKINILSFKNIDDVTKIVPILNITKKDKLRADLRSSAWIMGKLLKLLVFIHSEGFSVELINGNNILIEPDKHYIMIFDWSKAKTHTIVPTEIKRREISQMAQAIIQLLGGNHKTNTIPDDGEEAYTSYTQKILQLAHGAESKAERAHRNFYNLIDQLWKREYYPFTTKPLNQ